MHSVKFFLMATIFMVTSTASIAGSKYSTINVGLTIGGSVKKSRNIKARYTCGAAKQIAKISGFRDIEVVNCKNSIYRFLATSNGHNLVVSVNSLTGKIVKN